MLSSEWLQGGPFLEVSFLLKLQEEKKKTVQKLINKLSNVTNKIEIVDKNIDGMIDDFDRGYPYDEEDSESSYIHSLTIRLYVYLSRKRKATLQIELVSSNAFLVNFWFFGSEFDAPEWGQISIKEEELSDFTNFLTELYLTFQYKVGGVAIEQDILSLFNCNEGYPSECYRYENVLLEHVLRGQPHFINVLWNEKYEKLTDIPYNYKRINKFGLLTVNHSFYSEF